MITLKLEIISNLGRVLGIKKMKPVDSSLLWQGELDTDLITFSSLIEKQLGRVPSNIW